MAQPHVAPPSDHRKPSRYALATITESEISMLVDAFYIKVREDATIGPVFNGAGGLLCSPRLRPNSFDRSMPISSPPNPSKLPRTFSLPLPTSIAKLL